MKTTVIVARFDAFLAAEGLHLEAIIVGGAALGLLGLITRETRDCDVLAPSLPEEILAAARRFASVVRSEGFVLRDDWLNNGPESLGSVLPQGWRSRLQLAFTGQAIVLHTLAREDLLKTKLCALRPWPGSFGLPGARTHGRRAGRGAAMAGATGPEPGVARARPCDDRRPRQEARP